MPRVWLSIGSNQDRERCIAGAVQALRDRFGPLILSRVYETQSVGFKGQPFYNLVAGVESDASPASLIAALRDIENAFGRRRGPDKFAPRTLDIDLLTYGDLVSDDPALDIPRSEIARYAFVLGPLAEVAGEERHPRTGRSYAGMWADFDCEGQALQPMPFDFSPRR
jgi:2-amino-4-hydroxy-6-hydroxymethyldihydropteridine diphosphokinase